MKIEAIHEFHDKKFSEEWAKKFKPTKERISLFETILQIISLENSPNINILELGIGPGFLAKFILERTQNVVYEGLDFSNAMLKISSEKLSQYSNRIYFLQANLIEKNWIEKVKTAPNIIVSTWALHDLLKKEHIFNVYKSAFKLLPVNGLLINGDFIKPENSPFEYEEGRIKPSEHLALLKKAGFKSVKLIKEFEKNSSQPTTSNNYACFTAQK